MVLVCGIFMFDGFIYYVPISRDAILNASALTSQSMLMDASPGLIGNMILAWFALAVWFLIIKAERYIIVMYVLLWGGATLKFIETRWFQIGEVPDYTIRVCSTIMLFLSFYLASIRLSEKTEKLE